MKIKRKHALILLIAIISVSTFAMSMVAMGESTYYDFEEGKFNWNSLYGSLAYEFPTEASGNRYMKLTYNPPTTPQREYFDVAVI